MKIDDLIKETQKAVRLREKGETNSSRKLFKKIILQAEALKKSKNKEDLNTYVYLMSEWVIQLRHEGKRAYFKALQTAKEVYDFNRIKRLKNPRAVRGISNTLMNLEAYEEAKDYLEEMLKFIPETDSARRGDTLAHLARCYFRTSKASLAEEKLAEAIVKINKNTGHSSTLEIAVWKSHALLVKAILFYSKGKLKEALHEANEALAIAKSERIISRIKEASEIIDYLKSKLKLNG